MAKRKSTTSTAESRKSSAQALLKTLGQSVYSDLDEGRFPSLTLASRSVRNIVYDKKLQQFVLGATTVKKSSANIKHIRPFTQLVWLASFAKKLVDEKRTSTLRDVFYSAQAFNVEFQDQAESDELITDLEVLMQMAREGMNIYPEERSAIFGNMTIEYTVPGYEGKKADLSANPDGVMIGPALTTAEFADTDAEMVLAIEKGGLFTRFIEERVHDKHKALLINTAGQPPRSTRYLLRRLNQELKLPVGILCDSVAGEEPILIKGKEGTEYVEIGEFVDRLFGQPAGSGPEWRVVQGEGWECIGMNPKTMTLGFHPIETIYRHRVPGPLFRIELQDGRTIAVTKDHSLFTLKEGVVVPIRGSDIKAGEFLMVPHRLPDPGVSQAPRFDLREYALQSSARVSERTGLVYYTSSPAAGVPRFINLSPDLAWVLGFWVAEGDYASRRAVRFSQSVRNKVKADELVRRLQSAFGVEPSVYLQRREGHDSLTISLTRKALQTLFEKGFGLVASSADQKEIPALVWGFPRNLKLDFVSGLLAGDGHVKKSKFLTLYSTKRRKLASQLSYLLFSLGFSNKISKDRHGQYTIYIHGYGMRGLNPWLEVKSFPELFQISGFGLFQRLQKKVSYSRLIPRVEKLLAGVEGIAHGEITERGLLTFLSKKGFVRKEEGRFCLTRAGFWATAMLRRALKLLESDLHPAEVKRVIRLPGERVVYDLSVPDSRSFVAGDFCTLVHNSDPWGAHIAMVIKSGSVQRDEPITVKDAFGKVSTRKIGDFVDQCIVDYGYAYDSFGNEVSRAPFETLTLDSNNKVRFQPMSAAIRHPHSGPMYSLKTSNGKSVVVTPNHSVFVFRSEMIQSVPTTALTTLDQLVTTDLSYVTSHENAAFSMEYGETTSTGSRNLGLQNPVSTIVQDKGGSVVNYEPIVEIKKTSPVDEYVYDLSVPGVERFIGGRSGILLHNSANAAHLRELTTPDAVWLGVWPSDILKYKLPSDKLTDIDIKRVYELKADPRYTEKIWHDELDLFLKHKRKSEQEAFARYGLSYIVDKYLPEKLKLMKSA